MIVLYLPMLVAITQAWVELSAASVFALHVCLSLQALKWNELICQHQNGYRYNVWQAIGTHCL